jgi:protein SCO1/2
MKRLGTLAMLVALAVIAPAHAGRDLPREVRDVGISQRLDQPVPSGLCFQDESGKAVRLGDYFGDKPVILVLAYFRCPRLCTQVLNGLVEGLRGVRDLSIGDEFSVLTVSFDPEETPDLARAKKEAYLASYGRPGAAKGWHFLTGKDPAIKQLAEAVGFRYAYDRRRRQYVHASGIMVLTPQGKIARYFFGIRYSSRDLRFGLIEASHNKIGKAVDQALLLFCFGYDSATGTYRVMVLNLVRLGGLITVLIIAAALVIAWRREKRRPTEPGPAVGHSPLAPVLGAEGGNDSEYTHK